MNVKSVVAGTLFSVFSCSLPLGAETFDPQKGFEEANAYYEKGDYQKAQGSYIELLKLGYGGPALYYNLGNLYYRLGDRGKAILWYERAKRLVPRDPDVGFNLALAQSHLKKAGPSFFEKILLFFSSPELAYGMTALVWIFFITLGLVILGKGRGLTGIPVLLWSSGILLALFSSWFFLNLNYQSKPWAVVLSPPGEVRNGPGDDYAVGFTLPEGSKVLILNERPTWTEIGIPEEGLKGWIPSSEVHKINDIQI